jgi:hypothetical protein
MEQPAKAAWPELSEVTGLVVQVRVPVPAGGWLAMASWTGSATTAAPVLSPIATVGCVAKAAPDVAVALGAVLNDELAATAPTVNDTTSEPEAPLLPAVPPAPLAVLLESHCVVTAPQLTAVAVTFV